MIDDSNGATPERIEIISSGPNAQIRWSPIIGEETLQLSAYFEEQKGINPDEVGRIRGEAVSVLSKCVPPDSTRSAQSTGLVIGYVQSGKTMSFITVAALARDNGYPLVIVIAGTSRPLLQQSTTRLQNDLRLASRRDRAWHHIESTSLRDNDYRRIEDALRNWRDPDVPNRHCQTILITVMKHHIHLRNLRDVLCRVNLADIPILVIDDEADQASLNTQVNQNDFSTTYRRILELKECFPHHTFLQYTATPQAPLLINLIDVLSPEFAQILTPGVDYVGGEEFFGNANELVRTIPNQEVPTRRNPLTAPPESLMEALRLFFLGVAIGVVVDESSGNRSMLIHPTRRTVGHHQYYVWVQAIKNQWERILELPSTNIDRRELIEDFLQSYQDILLTSRGLPDFEDLLNVLRFVIRSTQVEEINAATGPTPTINWHNSYAHILVGGQAMDRGFTVEGLTITYMPRAAGVGNADTIQQRARFFGYKRTYLNYCRVFLENRVRDAFRDYVTHEEDIRRQISEHEQSGRPLTEWRRAFFLSRRLRPTRNSVLDLDYMRGNFAARWFWPRAPHDSDMALRTNRETVASFVNSVSWADDTGRPERTQEQRHHVSTNLSLRFVYENLLVPMRHTRLRDSQNFTGLLLQAGSHLEQFPDEVCTAYHMSKGLERLRRTNQYDEIPTLFQGRNPRTGTVIYPGDSAIRTTNGVSVQIHNLNVVSSLRGDIHNVPVLAVWMPREMESDWIVQN